MKVRHCLFVFLLFALAIALPLKAQSDPPTTSAAMADQSATKHNEAIYEAIVTPNAEIPFIYPGNLYSNLDPELVQMFKGLKWETKANHRGIGSPKAKKGGTLKYVESSYPPSLRTMGKNANSVFNSMMDGLCYEAMLEMDPITLNYVPNLARYWAIAEDKISFFFFLDADAKWADGKPVIAQDVVRTWKLCTDPGIEDPFSIDFWNKYEEPIALSDNVVMIRAKELNWRAFMSIACSMTILPSHVLKDIDGKQYLKEFQNKLMPGSGPYAYESAKVNEEIILYRRADWWQKDKPKNIGLYNFDQLNFIFIKDDNLIKLRFKKGDIDFYAVNVAREWHQEFTPTMLKELAYGYIQRRKIYTHRPIGTSGIAFNIRKPPFNDIRVRQAFAHLYNREKMMDKLFFNEYQYLDSFYPNSPYESPNNPKTRYNPDKSVELLEQAGWLQKNRDSGGWLTKNGERFEVDINYIQKSSERIMTVFQEDLKDIGIKLNLKQVTWATDIKEIGERSFKISSRAYSGLLFPNPESSLHSKFADLKNNNNIWGFKNARVDAICAEYPTMFDPKDRIAAVREIDGIVTKECLYALGWYSATTRLLFWDKFGMPDYYLSKTGDHSSITSYWWFDEDKSQRLQKAMDSQTRLEIGEEEIRWWDKHYPPSTGE